MIQDSGSSQKKIDAETLLYIYAGTIPRLQEEEASSRSTALLLTGLRTKPPWYSHPSLVEKRPACISIRLDPGERRATPPHAQQFHDQTWRRSVSTKVAARRTRTQTRPASTIRARPSSTRVKRVCYRRCAWRACISPAMTYPSCKSLSRPAPSLPQLNANICSLFR